MIFMMALMTWMLEQMKVYFPLLYAYEHMKMLLNVNKNEKSLLNLSYV